jgi:dephospho-CoA kinase
MKYVGLTGGIGSGKSTVGRIFSALGIPVYCSDKEGRVLSDTHPDIVNGLVNLFGRQIYNNGVLQRQQLASLIFNDKVLLGKVNAIIHPVVEQHFLNWAKGFVDAPYVVKEAAILIENEGYKKVDHLILVVAPQELRIRRVMLRDGVAEGLVRERIKNQLGDEEKTRYAHSVIHCDEHRLVIPQVISIHKKLLLV